MISASDQYRALVAKLEAINPSNVTENAGIMSAMSTPVEECGSMMSMAPKQQDNVTMNVTAQGAGGIRDLMNLLHSMEQAGNDEIVIGAPEGEIEIPVADENIDGGFGDATTQPEEDIFGVDDVVKTGDDMHSKGAERPKMNGGGNPMQEALVSQLAKLYNEIKEAKEEKFDALKHVKNPTKGEEEAAKDVKRGSYKDRAAMLKSAETDGRLKQEAYNPNSVDAEHRRGLEKSHEDSLKKKAADGDASAKKHLQALKDKKERMSNDYNDRMER